VRRPTPQMMAPFDVLLLDLQDLGCRVYTFLTTLRYVLEAAAEHGKGVWVLDRPNPAGRPVEGVKLRPGWESFVGAGALPMRHGITLGEAGRWLIHEHKLDLDFSVIEMKGWKPDAAPGFGWPLGEREWVNPSPNAPNLSMARCYPGTVMLEGTTLSEGRGTTRPLEQCAARRRIVADEARSRHRRERNRSDELRIVATSVAPVRIGPAPVEYVLAVAVRLRVERHSANQFRLVPRRQEARCPAGFGCSATRAMQCREILVRQQRQVARKLIPVVRSNLRQRNVVSYQR